MDIEERIDSFVNRDNGMSHRLSPESAQLLKDQLLQESITDPNFERKFAALEKLPLSFDVGPQDTVGGRLPSTRLAFGSGEATLRMDPRNIGQDGGASLIDTMFNTVKNGYEAQLGAEQKGLARNMSVWKDDMGQGTVVAKMSQVVNDLRAAAGEAPYASAAKPAAASAEQDSAPVVADEGPKAIDTNLLRARLFSPSNGG